MLTAHDSALGTVGSGLHGQSDGCHDSETHACSELVVAGGLVVVVVVVVHVGQVILVVVVDEIVHGLVVVEGDVGALRAVGSVVLRQILLRLRVLAAHQRAHHVAPAPAALLPLLALLLPPGLGLHLLVRHLKVDVRVVRRRLAPQNAHLLLAEALLHLLEVAVGLLHLLLLHAVKVLQLVLQKLQVPEALQVHQVQVLQVRLKLLVLVHVRRSHALKRIQTLLADL
mmetsp:Transcript_33485/g.73080  ORF Transcript_33485/g.73080 Transcript_33485/m.73080 type:complete len:227 (-) Transcript_33485:811-1491(-)